MRRLPRKSRLASDEPIAANQEPQPNTDPLTPDLANPAATADAVTNPEIEIAASVDVAVAEAADPVALPADASPSPLDPSAPVSAENAPPPVATADPAPANDSLVTPLPLALDAVEPAALESPDLAGSTPPDPLATDDVPDISSPEATAPEDAVADIAPPVVDDAGGDAGTEATAVPIESEVATDTEPALAADPTIATSEPVDPIVSGPTTVESDLTTTDAFVVDSDSTTAEQPTDPEPTLLAAADAALAANPPPVSGNVDPVAVAPNPGVAGTGDEATAAAPPTIVSGATDPSPPVVLPPANVEPASGTTDPQIDDAAQPTELAALDTTSGGPPQTISADDIVPVIEQGLSERIAELDCGALRARFDIDNLRVAVTGHYDRRSIIGQVQTQLAGLPGVVNVDISGAVQLDRPHCHYVDQLIDAGVTLATESDEGWIGEAGASDTIEVRPNEPFLVDLSGFADWRHVYVDYFDLDRRVVHVFPDPSFGNEQIGPGGSVRAGAGAEGVQLRADGTPGSALIMVLATSRPLFPGTQPMVEEARPYVGRLSGTLLEAQIRDRSFQAELAYIVVSIRR